jgi:DNA polymerase-4
MAVLGDVLERRGMEPVRTRRILHADADAFFVAVARLVDPEGAGRARYLLVGGSAEHRGVVTSASYETRVFGVRSGMPMAQALRLCPAAVRVPVPRGACAEKSREIRRVLERFTPAVEPASIDEFYLDLSGTEQLYGDEPLDDTATRIRTTVLQETQTVVSVGGGTSRLLAKLASRRAKPHGPSHTRGVFVVDPGDEGAFLAEHDLAAIPGIGPKFQQRLQAHGLRTVRDALPLEERTLVARFGEGAGRWLYRRIRGLDTTPVHPHLRSRSMGHETTFATDIDDDGTLDSMLSRLASQVAADLRGKQLRARTVTVKIRDADFRTRQASRTLPGAVAADSPFVRTARSLLVKLRSQRRVSARLLGVSVSQLEPTDTTQLSLFDTNALSGLETERDRALSDAVDTINNALGRRRIVRGSEISPSS